MDRRQADMDLCDLCGFPLLNQPGGWMPFSAPEGTVVVCTRHVRPLVLSAVRERAALETSERRRAG